MSVFKKYKGKRITPSDPNWNLGVWYLWKRVGNDKVIHKALKGVTSEEEALEVETAIIRKFASKSEGRHVTRLAKQVNSIMASEKPEYLYVLESGGYFKIGFTTQIDRRLKAISDTIIPFDTNLLFAIKLPDAEKMERLLHKAFASKRLQGEWFQLSEADLTDLKLHVFGLKRLLLRETSTELQHRENETGPPN